MVEKQIIVKKPITTNGVNPWIGENGLPVYKESIAPASVKAKFERMNEKLPQHLRYKFEDYSPPPNSIEPVVKQTPKPVAQ